MKLLPREEEEEEETTASCLCCCLANFLTNVILGLICSAWPVVVLFLFVAVLLAIYGCINRIGTLRVEP